MNFDELSDELKAKVRETTSAEELRLLAGQEGVELADEQLEGVAGGGWSCDNNICNDHVSSLPED